MWLTWKFLKMPLCKVYAFVKVFLITVIDGFHKRTVCVFLFAISVINILQQIPVCAPSYFQNGAYFKKYLSVKMA